MPARGVDVNLGAWLSALASPPAGAGLRAWSVYATATRRLSLRTKDAETGNAHAPLAVSESLGARFLVHWEDGKVTRGSLERRQLEREPAQALRAARAAAYDDPDAAQVRGPSSLPDVRLHDEATARAAAGDAGALAGRLEACRGWIERGGFGTWSGGFTASESESRIVTSAGLDASARSTSFSWHLGIEGKIGTGHASRCFEPEPEYDARIARLVTFARALEQTAPLEPGGVIPVVLHPDVVEEFVVPGLLHHLDAATVAHEEGRFRPQDFGSGRPMLREDLTVRLDPTLPLKSGSYRFTIEGVPAARCTYVDRGRLVTPVADLKYARRLGISPTPVPYAFDTLCIESPDAIDAASALERASGGILVLAVLGVHTLDAASGDYSLAVPQALRLGAGPYEGHVRGTISGNLFDLLRSDRLRWVRFDGEALPGLLAPGRFDPK